MLFGGCAEASEGVGLATLQFSLNSIRHTNLGCSVATIQVATSVEAAHACNGQDRCLTTQL